VLAAAEKRASSKLFVTSHNNGTSLTYSSCQRTLATAAVLLRGRTVHSAIGLQCQTTSINEKVASATTTALIQQAAVLVIDEVSMIGLTLLNKIDVRLRALRQRDEPFGGMSVVFSGDLLQLPPIADVPVWNTESTTKECVTGRELWRLVDHVVFLTVNMRSGGDQRYADMLERIRYGEWRQADIDMINTRLLNDRLQLQADYASAIVHINAARITINK
jgi:ATP-dependent DNA helicase PIF1